MAFLRNIRFREARASDAPGIADVHVRAWRTGYAHIMPAGYLAALDVQERTLVWEQTLLNKDLQHVVWVALHGQQVVGWETHGVSRDPDATAGTGELQGLYVHPDWWNGGIGSKLVDNALRMLAAEPLKRVTLWVLEANVRSIRFYRGHGFRADGARQQIERGGRPLPKVRMARDVDPLA